MDRKALVYITSRQSIDDEGIEMVSPGRLYCEDGFFKIVYDETEISGMSGTTTIIKMFDDRMVLEREGSTVGRMEFQKHNDNVSLYDTPYGTLELIIKTNDISVNMSEDGGTVDVDYNITLKGQKSYRTILNIKIKA